MTPTVTEWIEKAEVDFEAASILAQSRSLRQSDTICYHCQQCIEKYLKALLQHNQDYVPKTHNLVALLDELVDQFPLLEAHRESCLDLSRYSTVFRYPGLCTSREDAKLALRECAGMRSEVRRYLGLEQL